MVIILFYLFGGGGFVREREREREREECLSKVFWVFLIYVWVKKCVKMCVSMFEI